MIALMFTAKKHWGCNMLTLKEAMARAALYGVIIRRSNPASTEWRVTLVEWPTDEKRSYYTDCLEDALLTGMAMRNKAMFR